MKTILKHIFAIFFIVIVISSSVSFSSAYPEVIDIRIYSQEMILSPGETEILYVQPIPDTIPSDQIEYISSDTSVATVNGYGTIKAKKEGLAVITVSISDSNIVKTCTVKVVDSESEAEVATSSISAKLIDNEGAPLADRTLQFQGENSKKSYISTTGSTGIFQYEAIEPGEYQIYLLDSYGNFSAAGTMILHQGWNNLAISVSGMDLSVSYGTGGGALGKLSLAQTAVKIAPGETYSIEILQNSAPIKPPWSEFELASDNPDVATVDDSGNITGQHIGITNISIKTKDGSFSATCEVTVSKLTNEHSLLVVFIQISFVGVLGLAFWLYYRKFIEKKIKKEKEKYGE